MAGALLGPLLVLHASLLARSEPVDGYELAGGYEVGNGPHWTTHPLLVSCTDKCGDLWGNGVWTCSTSSAVVNGQAWYSVFVWGCVQVLGDTGGGRKGSYNHNGVLSAWVDDVCDHGETNYCFRAAATTTTSTPLAALLKEEQCSLARDHVFSAEASLRIEQDKFKIFCTKSRECRAARQPILVATTRYERVKALAYNACAAQLQMSSEQAAGTEGVFLAAFAAGALSATLAIAIAVATVRRCTNKRATLNEPLLAA
mmetsp:Transcript_111310/g.309986  ORF Transcript_111310/g.309986 Transcript_111310/m.309986 type:complete len:257 (+) Transcript_111310:80-850(+)